MRNNTCAFPISADEMKNLMESTFANVFPEVVQLENVKKEKGKVTEEDVKRIFNIR